MDGLLSRRELLAWAGCFVLMALLLVVTGFTSADPDSALYADLASRLAAGPASHWIAPEWWGNWEMTGLFREHPAGLFLLPTALGALGLPAIQASYIVGIAAALGCVLLMASLIGRVSSAQDGRFALVLLQLMPLAFIFRIRANHEYPMLFFLLVSIVGIDAVRQRWRHVWITPAALSAAMLVKGVFVAVPILAVGLWMLINPRRLRGGLWRAVMTCVASVAVMATVALIYDAIYLRATGETFWGPYWNGQLAPLTVTAPGGSDEAAFGPHLRFYLVRMLWHPAPWSFALLLGIWNRMRHRRAARPPLSPEARRGLVFAPTFAVVGGGF
jgi:4-amino-4-deoxy-L-arabinose transferase-like glycosyltransferase